MKKLALGSLACALLGIWLAPIALALVAGQRGLGALALAATAVVCAIVQFFVLTPGYALALRLERCPGQIGAACGVVSGLLVATPILLVIDAASPTTLIAAAICAATSGVVVAQTLHAAAVGHWFPRAPLDHRPSHWWYWGRAVYVSRRDYRRILLAFLAVGVPLGTLGLLGPRVLLDAAIAIAMIGVGLLVVSLVGLYRMYGHPSLGYYARLLQQGGVRDGARIADLHIGTYRTAFAIADLLPTATVESIDCWDTTGPQAEEAVGDVRELEAPPAWHPRIHAGRVDDAGRVPLDDASCDAIVLGFGTHEIPTGGPRERLFAEAQRVLKPGGVALLFEHGYDFHNYMIFGPVIDHVTRKTEWIDTMRRFFADVTYARSSAAVDMLAGRRHA